MGMASYYINNLTFDSAKKYVRQYGLDFTDEEIRVLLAFAKENQNDFQRKNKPLLLAKLEKRVSPTTYQKIVRLLAKFGF